LDGYEAVRAVPGSVDGEEFLDFIVNDVVRHNFYLYESQLNYLPAAKDESLPSRQEYSDSQQLCDPQDKSPLRNT